MRYGLSFAAAGACGDPRTVGELARVAEASGWDGIFLEDYIVHWDGGPTYDPWIALAAVALNTERLLIGTTVTPLARRRPWKVASEAVSLDHLSNGRFILGVGLGFNQGVDFAGFGEVTDKRTMAAMLDEALEVIVGLWRGEPFSYAGRHFQVREVTLLPKPVQTPRIPIWVGGGYPNPGPLRRAARWDGSVMYKETHGGSWLDMMPDDVRGLKDFVERQRTASLPSPIPYEIAVGGRERAADWEQDRMYVRALAQAGATWWMEHIPPDEPDLVRAKIERGPLRID
jgi:alkanesulfonate monooxygenase SsuD/methylene tetrahydromethanopterin reductase-like flavin-dependent oxidoreductase (luciferase family)